MFRNWKSTRIALTALLTVVAASMSGTNACGQVSKIREAIKEKQKRIDAFNSCVDNWCVRFPTDRQYAHYLKRIQGHTEWLCKNDPKRHPEYWREIKKAADADAQRNGKSVRSRYWYERIAAHSEGYLKHMKRLAWWQQIRRSAIKDVRDDLRGEPIQWRSSKSFANGSVEYRINFGDHRIWMHLHGVHAQWGGGKTSYKVRLLLADASGKGVWVSPQYDLDVRARVDAHERHKHRYVSYQIPANALVRVRHGVILGKRNSTPFTNAKEVGVVLLDTVAVIRVISGDPHAAAGLIGGKVLRRHVR